jgi:hypothetical protein
MFAETIRRWRFRQPAILLITLGFSLATFTAFGGPDDPTQVLARWRGGELTRQTFRELYDRDGDVLAGGGERLQIRICKASYTEVYYHRALALGLDRQPEHLAEMADFRHRRLASLYRKRHPPKNAGEVSQEALKAEYASRLEDFTTPAEADLDVLFVGCEGDRQGCRQRMATLRERLAGGEALASLIVEEKVRSGAANGTFRQVALEQLAKELRGAVAATAPGSFTPVVETPIGLFWVKVLRRQAPELLPFDRFERQIRNQLSRRQLAHEKELQVTALRQKYGAGLSAKAEEAPDEESLFVAAARAEDLDQDPELQLAVKDFSRFALADRAFYLDKEILPSDEELVRQLNEPQNAARYRELSLLLAVIPPQAERYAALRQARELAGELAVAPDPAALLRHRGEEDPRLQIQQLGPLTLRQLQRQYSALPKPAAELNVGQWQGPFKYEHTPPGEPDSMLTGLAFLLLEATRDPTFDELRQDLLKDFRGRLASSLDSFYVTFGHRWGLEVLPPPPVAGGGKG